MLDATGNCLHASTLRKAGGHWRLPTPCNATPLHRACAFSHVTRPTTCFQLHPTGHGGESMDGFSLTGWHWRQTDRSCVLATFHPKENIFLPLAALIKGESTRGASSIRSNTCASHTHTHADTQTCKHVHTFPAHWV